MQITRRVWPSLALALLLGAGQLPAHELDANRATLILREPGLVSLALFVDYPLLLQRILAPQETPEQFLLTASAMPPDKFREALGKAQQQLQSGTQLLVSGGRAEHFTRWNWPDAPRVQALLRERVMQQLTAPAAHPAESTLEVQAEVMLKPSPTSLRLQIAPAFGRVLVVWYRPDQQWVEPGAASLVMPFR
jgi:hypothetical protein